MAKPLGASAHDRFTHNQRIAIVEFVLVPNLQNKGIRRLTPRA